jgi:hypothetical protein
VKLSEIARYSAARALTRISWKKTPQAREILKGEDMKLFAIILIIFCAALATPLLAQDQPADNRSIVLEKAKADKKLLVAANMQLTEGEAKTFWPLYESYQRDIGKINDRLIKLIDDYTASYKSMTDAAANRMVDEAVAIESDRTKLAQTYLPRFKKVLPPTKVARYYQI